MVGSIILPHIVYCLHVPIQNFLFTGVKLQLATASLVMMVLNILIQV